MVSNVFFAQIIGKISDEKQNALPFVNVFVENTYNSTTANEVGKYILNINKPGNYAVIFQYLGYKTIKKTVTIEQLPFELNITMAEENFTLNEVVINIKDNPAIAIY